MDEFKAIVTNEQKIEITSNTYWSCKAEGNFKLSQYDGSGDTIIDIIIPEDIFFSEGTVYFTYGDERCLTPRLSVLFNNQCYIRTIPSFSNCIVNNKSERDIYLMFDEPNTVFNISVFCSGDWGVEEAENCSYLSRQNELMIIAPSDKNGETNDEEEPDKGYDATLDIVPTQCRRNMIHVRLINKRKRSQEN